MEPQDSLACTLAWFDTGFSFANCMCCIKVSAVDEEHSLCCRASTNQSCVATEGSSSASFDFRMYRCWLCYGLGNHLDYDSSKNSNFGFGIEMTDCKACCYSSDCC